ncbi:MAG: hypothetical protein KBT19_05150 [Lachnospiraceae bacterium]|nr:hypothetical protein [Candidatus Colinaster equi]
MLERNGVELNIEQMESIVGGMQQEYEDKSYMNNGMKKGGSKQANKNQCLMTVQCKNPACKQTFQIDINSNKGYQCPKCLRVYEVVG